MIEELVSRTNLNRAFKQVVKNGGSAGIDQMKVTELGEYLKNNASQMCEEVREKKYQASPILGVEIPKPNGKKTTTGYCYSC